MPACSWKMPLAYVPSMFHSTLISTVLISYIPITLRTALVYVLRIQYFRFLYSSLHSAGGFDIPSHTFSCVGSPHMPISFTSKSDIGRVLAQLSILSMSSNPSAASSVPDFVRVCGTTKSYDDIKKIFEAEDESNNSFIEIKTTDLGIYRDEVKKAFLEENSDDPLKHLR